MISEWRKQTFSEALKRINFDQNVKLILEKTDFFNQIKERIMDGNSVTNIEGINEKDRGQFGFRMSDVFHDSIKESLQDTPIRYILKTTQALIEEKQNIKTISGNLGRSFRSFASFLRDYDARQKINKIIENYKEEFNIEILQDPELDAKFHADVIIKLNDSNHKMKFLIWLYQKTEKSLEKIIDRISGNRGKLPNGIHILIPIKRM